MVDPVDVSERGVLVPPEIPPEELDEQLGPGLDGPEAGSPGLDAGVDGVPEAVKTRTTRAASRPVGAGCGVGASN